MATANKSLTICHPDEQSEEGSRRINKEFRNFLQEQKAQIPERSRFQAVKRGELTQVNIGKGIAMKPGIRSVLYEQNAEILTRSRLQVAKGG